MILLGDEREEAGPDELLSRAAEELAVGVVDERPCAVGQPSHDELGLTLHDGSVARLVAALLLLGSLAVSHVHREADASLDRVAVAAQRLDMHLVCVAVPLELERLGMSVQRAAMLQDGIEFRVVAPEVLVQRHADNLVRHESQAGESGAARGCEAEVTVHGPENCGHLPDDERQPGLAAQARGLGALALAHVLEDLQDRWLALVRDAGVVDLERAPVQHAVG